MEITNNYKDYNDDIEEQQTAETVSLLMMIINGQDFALHFENVVQIAQLEEIYPVPEFPDYILGFARIGEGAAIPVIDLRKRFGFEANAADDKRCIVVVKDEHDIRQGLVVDAVRQLRQTAVAQIMPAPKLGDEYTKYITGMFTRKNGNICYIIEPKLMYKLSANGMRIAKKFKIKKEASEEKSEG